MFFCFFIFIFCGTLLFGATFSVLFISFPWAVSGLVELISQMFHRFDEIIVGTVFRMSVKQLAQPLRERAVKMSYSEHVIPVTTGEVKCVLYPELFLWANLMCLPQSLFWLPPCRIFLSLALEGFWLAKIKHELLRLPDAVDGPKHRSRVRVISHLVTLTILLWAVKTDPESVVRGNFCLQPTQLTPPGHKCLCWHHTLF